jgi:molecular chaperone DnaJ
LRLSGGGEAGVRGASPGDLYITISLKKHEFFVRDGDDILYGLTINFAQAALGAEVAVPILQGEVKLKVPAGSQSGKVFKLKGSGIPHLHSGGQGDQLVRLSVLTPESLSREQRRLLEELARTMSPAQKAKGDS